MMSDSDARSRSLDTAASFLVQAPAGSGKTELLIQRYMRLLGTVQSPDAVVAITFTKKAAAEMRLRVLDALRKVVTGVAPKAAHQSMTFEIAGSVLDRDRTLGWNLLQNPAQMRIQTIDALCASITRRMPWLARFGAMPGISEKAEDLYREAARNTLQHVEKDNEALSQILLHLDNDFTAAERLIVQMLERRDQWLRHTRGGLDFGSVRSDLEGALQHRILAELGALRDAVDAAGVAAELAVLLGLDRFPGAQLDDRPQWDAVVNLLLTSDGKWRQRVNKNCGFPAGHPLKSRCERLLAHLRSETDLLEALKLYRELPDASFTDSQWQVMQAAVSVLRLAVAELHIVFRERGCVDFAELAIRAGEALGRLEEPTDLALALGHHIQHILVDEFQDTSYTQFELLEKLTAGWDPGDGRTLFLVGDPMQSIYRFREADVSLLLAARDHGIGNIRFEPLTLSQNFRSEPQIVEWVNEHFKTILPPKDDVDSGAVSYSPSEAAKSSRDAGVEIHPCLDAQAEADRVLEILKSEDGGKTAILVRARAHLAAIVNVLKRNKVPFQAVEIDPLGERPVVQDLMALTFALLHPADRVSWLAVLRAPWCGLTLRDLHALASKDPGAATWDLLHNQNCALSEDGAARVQRILSLLEQARTERRRRRLRDWIENVWLRLGGPACIDDFALQDAAAYFELLEGLEQGADLDDFEWLRNQVNLLFARPNPEAGDRLQLMTIHKAKGLEFDTVILPALGATPRQDEQRLLLWLEQRGELLLAPIAESGQPSDHIYHYLARMERRKAEHETARLLYVATTRARRRLHLLGAPKRKEDGSITEPDPRSFLKLLWPAVSGAFLNLSGAPVPEPAGSPRTIRRLKAGWQVPAPPPAVTWAAGRIPKLELPRVTFEWAGERQRHAGTALHGLLERIAREGLAAWSENAIRSRCGLYRAMLANLGVPPSELRQAAEHVEAGLLRAVRDPRGRWILEAHIEAECELAIAGLIDGKLCEAVIDRTFVDEQGVRWIIDYKTGGHQGADIEAFLDSERERYQEQLERYARLLFQREARPIRLGLYFPLLGGWREWPAPVVLRLQASLFEL
ncbi:MAG TPA: UvrD-helicase domain-containing protein [Bryobacteraceae bacterium]|nr:UvrD-helicase domain-containing protein [Bryobacteraceae bacterium]